MKNSIYFLCSGNACRSQMAEGYAKKYLPNWDIQSAGIRADGLNPRAVKAMAADGIDISTQTSKTIDNDFMQNASVVVTLCGDARDKCIIPKSARWLHWPLDDPAQVTGSEAEIQAAFYDIRDEIKEDVLELVQYIQNHS